MNLTVLVNAGPWLAVPPEGYGGIEAVVATLVPELRRAGVQVVLATVGTSTLEADGYVRPIAEPRFHSVAAPYNQASGIAHAHMCGVVAALRDDRSIDLVHDHLEVVGPAVLMATGEQSPPTLQTLHWDLCKHADFYSTFDGHGRLVFAAVSRSQLDVAPPSLAPRQSVSFLSPCRLRLTLASNGDATQLYWPGSRETRGKTSLPGSASVPECR